MKIYYLFKKKRAGFESIIFLAITLLGNTDLFDFETFIVKMTFFTNVVDFQAALSASLTVHDWEMLTSAKCC